MNSEVRTQKKAKAKSKSTTKAPFGRRTRRSGQAKGTKEYKEKHGKGEFKIHNSRFQRTAHATATARANAETRRALRRAEKLRPKRIGSLIRVLIESSGGGSGTGFLACAGLVAEERRTGWKACAT